MIIEYFIPSYFSGRQVQCELLTIALCLYASVSQSDNWINISCYKIIPEHQKISLHLLLFFIKGNNPWHAKVTGTIEIFRQGDEQA